MALCIGTTGSLDEIQWLRTAGILNLNNEDVRRKLLLYADNPHNLKAKEESIKSKSDSPFEETVAGYLVERNYDVKQQWPVGKYRIDMAFFNGKTKVALECDGERYHSGERKIREDMERQTILERIGWQFIRLRGSEYYRNPEEAMQRVTGALNEYGIYPVFGSFSNRADTMLADEITRRAEQYRQEGL